MKLEICGELRDGEIVPINSKGCDEIEIDVVNIICFQINNKASRLVGLGKAGLFRLTLNSYKKLKRYLLQNNQAYRYI